MFKRKSYTANGGPSLYVGVSPRVCPVGFETSASYRRQFKGSQPSQNREDR